MPQTYTVVEGDYLSGIAEKFGFRDFQTIWDDPGNDDIRTKRSDPQVLMPGDAISIPDKQQKTETGRATNQLHTFVVDRPRLILKLAVRDFDDLPVANADCELEIDGATYNLQTDSNGQIQHEIPRTAKGGTLKIPSLGYEMPVKVGHLDPIDESTGWLARLINLGYHPGPLDNPDKLLIQYAIEEFQCDNGINVTGVLDDSTQGKLKEKHGG